MKIQLPKLAKCFVSMLLLEMSGSTIALEISGIGQINYTDVNENPLWAQSWLRGGTGLTRFDDFNEDVHLSQGILHLNQDISDSFAFETTALYYPDGEQRWGFSEAFVNYRPLSSGWRTQAKLGAFYPRMSRENSDIGWSSPYTYSFSAVNSWIGEEIRTLGAEISFTRPGRQYQSPHSFGFQAAVFNANDGAGSLLAWRGWALHDRQTRLEEKVRFSHYPSFVGSLTMQPAYVKPFKETDENLGGYLGAQWSYLNQHEFRTYYYNNLGDETKVESDGQYAWDTEFYSFAWYSQIAEHIDILAQWLQGQTLMGKNVVKIDFNAGYLLASYRLSALDLPQHRVSVRYDRFLVRDKDHYGMDINDSEGQAWTMAWRYQFASHHETGFEWLHIDSKNENLQLWGWPQHTTFNQIQFVFQYRFTEYSVF